MFFPMIKREVIQMACHLEVGILVARDELLLYVEAVIMAENFLELINLDEVLVSRISFHVEKTHLRSHVEICVAITLRIFVRKKKH
jgi:hypothetical protein